MIEEHIFRTARTVYRCSSGLRRWCWKIQYRGGLLRVGHCFTQKGAYKKVEMEQ